ncbi:unnamed protein product [Urochloa humidicola]
MQVSLEALELWDVVEEESKDRAKDRRALAAILRGVPPEMKAGLAVKASAKEAWDSVKKMRVKAANVQRLMKEFENLSFNDGETVGDFAARVDRLTARLRDHGEEGAAGTRVPGQGHHGKCTAHVVLLASPGVSHVLPYLPLAELARRIVAHGGGGEFTAMLVTYANFSSTDGHFATLTSLPPSISIDVLPEVPLDDLPADAPR